MEIWASGLPAPRGIVHVARDLEAQGWDGLNVVDSQNLAADPFVALAMAATVTTRLKLGTGVSNSVTRSAAALACAIASVHSVSKGRAVLGIGRGDSALAHLGRAPATLNQFDRYLRHLQAYLGGDAVAFDELCDIAQSVAPPVTRLQLADAPKVSRIGWIADTQQGERKVPVEVAATGPRVIAIAAVRAERVMFALGAVPEPIAWGIAIAREARMAAGLDPNDIAFGAYIPTACHTDIDTARQLVRGGLTVFARFNVMHGKTTGPLSDASASVMHQLRSSYDMHKHTHGDSAQAAALTAEFIDEFAAVGTPEIVAERLITIRDLGLDKIVVNGSWRNAKGEEGHDSKRLFETQVLPRMHI